ncbi:MAG TPA: beta-propeller fold lactonase family protein [Candidatus Limnocylindria bacterium]|nr:beta-propeller fold lactonase family protein [Candidatus Limnocylindria bacterium]
MPSAEEVPRPLAFPPEPRRTAVLLALHTGVRLTRSPRPNQSRGFRIGPKGRHAVVSGERSDTISVYEIDPTSAALKLLQKYPTG